MFDIDEVINAYNTLVFAHPYYYNLIANDRGEAEKMVIEFLKNKVKGFDQSLLRIGYGTKCLYDEDLGMVWRDCSDIMRIFYDEQNIAPFFIDKGPDFFNPLEIPDLNLDKLGDWDWTKEEAYLVQIFIQNVGPLVLWTEFKGEY